MSEELLDFDAYCAKFDLDPSKDKSKELYDTYTGNVKESKENSIFNNNSNAQIGGKDTIFD